MPFSPRSVAGQCDLPGNRVPAVGRGENPTFPQHSAAWGCRTGPIGGGVLAGSSGVFNRVVKAGEAGNRRVGFRVIVPRRRPGAISDAMLQNNGSYAAYP